MFYEVTLETNKGKIIHRCHKYTLETGNLVLKGIIEDKKVIIEGIRPLFLYYHNVFEYLSSIWLILWILFRR